MDEETGKTVLKMHDGRFVCYDLWFCFCLELYKQAHKKNSQEGRRRESERKEKEKDEEEKYLGYMHGEQNVILLLQALRVINTQRQLLWMSMREKMSPILIILLYQKGERSTEEDNNNILL